LSACARGPLGEHLKAPQWDFEVMTKENVPRLQSHRPCNGPHGLRHGVSSRFADPFECFSECGGMTLQFVARSAVNSNDHFWQHVKPKLGWNTCNGLAWTDMSIEDMCHFLGVMLKISLSTVNGGGHTACFSPCDEVICSDAGRHPKVIRATNSAGWAQHTMSLGRFKQMRGAFHPEDRVASCDEDKCHQLRHVLNRLNAASLLSFETGPNMSFDEGGSACRSRMCPVRQHDEDKPDKHRVDFFVLLDAKHCFIHHMDVCQGKNSHNVHIDKRASDLPATQKAVIIALCQTGLDNWTPFGCCMLAADNRHGCCELAAILRDCFRVCMTATTRQKRKGWDTAKMTLTKANSE